MGQLSNFANCNQSNYPINLSRLVFYPNPIEIGKNLTIEVNGTNTERIQSGATMTTSFYYYNELIDSKTYDLCIDLIETNGGKCPFELENFNFIAKTIPSVSSNYPINSSYTYNVIFTGNI